MPFVAPRVDPDSASDRPPDPLQLAYFSAREVNERAPAGRPGRARSPRWQVRTSFGYRAEDGRYFVVPAQTGDVGSRGNSTDLASVPGFLWGILAPYGRQLRPAVLHDHRCDVADGVIEDDADNRDAAGRPVPPGRSRTQLRTEADDLFREALRAEGVGPARSWMFWTGVAYGRFFLYARVRAIVLAALVFAAAVLGLHALTVAVGGGPPRVDGWLSNRAFWLAMLGIAVVLALLRRRALTITVPLSAITIVACLSAAGSDAPDVLHSLSWHAVAAGALLVAASVLGLVTDVRAALIALVIAPLILPVVLVTTLAQLVLALPDLIGWALHGYRGEEPITGPLFGPAGPTGGDLSAG
jgi:hypothetical protein